MKLLLDTCAFLWLIKGDKTNFSEETLEKILSPEFEVFLSVTSVWEIVLKNAIGKLPLPDSAFDFVTKSREDHHIASLPIEEADLEFFSKLGNFHRDPFDRILICQALRRQMSVVTNDGMIKRYPVRTII